MVVPLRVGRIDPTAATMGLYIVPRQDLHPLLHDPTVNLVTAAQYALGSLQKAGLSSLLPPLQATLRSVGAAFLRHVPRRFQGTQLLSHRRQAPNLLRSVQAAWGTSCGRK